MRAITAIILGAGQRGLIFADYAKRFPNELKIVGVAEPRGDRLREMAEDHGVARENTASDWEELLDRDKFADCVIIATQDRMHYEPAMKAMDKGYDILCEKPLSGNPQELIALENKATELGRTFIVAHSLRYSVFFSKIKELIDQGAIGDLVTIQHIESIGYWHMAHSFVRGNWRDSEETSPSIMAKCCHDIDMLGWLSGGNVEVISSQGSLKHFKSENRPEGAPDRCLDGCSYRDECPYYAPRFYLEHPKAKSDGFRKIVSIMDTDEDIIEELKMGPYGRCVYACDNNVCDNQIVNITYTNGVTASLTMSAFTADCERIINVMGTKGQIKGRMEDSSVTLYDFASGNATTINLHTPVGSHSGSDVIMVKSFVAGLNAGTKDISSAISKSVEGHLACIAAEDSRKKGGACIDFKQWCEEQKVE